MAEATRNVHGRAHALFEQPTPLQALAALQVPVLLMVGSESPASARGVARLLAHGLPNVAVQAFPGLGHMGPVTHPAVVDEAIAEFLERGSRAAASVAP